MQNTLKIIKEYIPYNQQEEKDKQTILFACQTFSNLLTRENPFCHFTASAFVLNKQKNKVLCCFHNIYNSWGWVGGHADGIDNLVLVAQKEAQEETSIKNLTPLSALPISLDILTTDGHFKRGQFVSGHVHFNLCFLFEADQNQPIKPKPDENKSVEWIELNKLPLLAREPQMKVVYNKIIQRIKNNKF